jgi:hypothetical protein
MMMLETNGKMHVEGEALEESHTRRRPSFSNAGPFGIK